MKKISLFFLALVNASLLFAQTDNAGILSMSNEAPSITMEHAIRRWNQGPLSFKDFMTRQGGLPSVAELDYAIGWGMRHMEKIGNTQVRTHVTETFMNPYESWVNPDYMSQDLLLYLQTAFDYVEICRRRAQAEFWNGSQYDLGSLTKFHLGVARGFNEKMRAETNCGQDTTAVRFFADQVRELMASTPEPLLAPDLYAKPKGWGIGIHLGLSMDTYSAPISAYTGTVVGLDFGFDFAIKRFMIYWDGMLGRAGRLKKSVSERGWQQGAPLKGGNITLSAGYPIYENLNWKVVPFAGIGVGFIDYPFATFSNKKEDELAGFRYQAGIAADFKFFRILERELLVDSLAEFSVRARVYVARTDIPLMGGPAWTFNVGLDAGYLARMIKKQ